MLRARVVGVADSLGGDAGVFVVRSEKEDYDGDAGC